VVNWIAKNAPPGNRTPNLRIKRHPLDPPRCRIFPHDAAFRADPPTSSVADSRTSYIEGGTLRGTPLRWLLLLGLLWSREHPRRSEQLLLDHDAQCFDTLTQQDLRMVETLGGLALAESMPGRNFVIWMRIHPFETSRGGLQSSSFSSQRGTVLADLPTAFPAFFESCHADVGAQLGLPGVAHHPTRERPLTGCASRLTS
jgi:hypothetical protein